MRSDRLCRKKGAHSEGSIYTKPDVRWRAAVSIGKNGNGKPKRKVFTATTHGKVADELKTALSNRQRGLKIDHGTITPGEFLKEWLENTAKP
jgi:hypothetical protein